jgi:regulator of protease activity HflC (stomatin/prohibitin superfamily)
MISIFLCLTLAIGLNVAYYFYTLEKHNDVQRNKRSFAYEKALAAGDKTFSFEADAFVPPVAGMSALILLGIGIGLLMSSFTIISAGHQGVQVTLGKVNMSTLGEGVHLVNPMSDIHNVSVRVTKAELKNANAGTKDLQIVHTDIVVNYRLDGSKVAHVYKEFGLELENKILLPAVNESFKAITAHYNSEELVTKRDEVSNAIHQQLQTKVAKYGLIVSEISLVNFGFSADYQAAIEQKVIATQKKLKAEQDLERIQVEAEQNIAKAKGEAESIRIQAQAIQNQGGKDYVQLKSIEKWDGKLPTMMMGNATPMINIK